MKYFYPILFIAPLLLTSCTMMKVQVQVIDRENIRQAPVVIAESLAEAVSKVESNLNSGFYHTTQTQIQNTLEEVKKNILDRGESNENDVNSYFNNIGKTVDSIISQSQSSHIKGLEAYYVASIIDKNGTNAEEKKKELYLKARYSFHSGNVLLLDLASILEQDLKIRLKGLSEEVKRKRDEEATALVEKVRGQGVAQGNPLADDPMLSIVIHAPKKYWKGISNKTVARTYFGHSDVAIAMESLGKYTIKGVRLDASNIVANSYKAMNFSLQLLAGAFGAPPQRVGVQQEMVETDNATEAIQLINTEEEKAKLEKSRQLNRLAAVSMLDAILSRTEELSNPAKTQKTVRDIQIIFNNYKPNFENNHD